MGIPSMRSWVDYAAVLAGLLILLGALGPWLWRGYDSYQVVDPETRDVELRYRLTTRMSPFYIVATSEGGEATTGWFISAGTTLSGVILIIAAALFPLRWKRLWVRGVLSAVSILGCMTFFLSLGGGLWLGLVTRFSWGFQATIVGVAVMLLTIFWERVS
jgi:hypothetical protein